MKTQLDEQVLYDGSHYELSPMYHQLMLFRVLDSIQLNKQHTWFNQELDEYLTERAQKMCSWLIQITFNNGDIPLVNDAAFNINPTTNQLIQYANQLGLSSFKQLKLSESGYRMIKKGTYELFLDIGVIQPNFQPGHAHADISNFIVYKNNLPYIIDSGTSTYEKSKAREFQRSSHAHNVVTIKNKSSSNVWSGFRVSKRAKIHALSEKSNEIKLGFKNFHDPKMIQTRCWKTYDNSILIEDEIHESEEEGTLNLHFHPNVTIKNISSSHIETNFGKITFDGHAKIVKLPFNFSDEFNKVEPSNKVVVTFKSTLKTQIAF